MKTLAYVSCVCLCLVAFMSCGADAPPDDAAAAPTVPESVDINEMFGTSLANAASDGDFEMVRDMVEAGADINKKTMYSETALMRAAESGHADIVEYLISQGADLYVENIYGFNVKVLAGSYPEILEMVNAAMEANPQ
ncbi:MAG: ankyrin repeat domain-containing protein [Spirochaeta sp.]|nr:ankyrin repeat domain-containing protein [Spirochaeta sp.]